MSDVNTVPYLIEIPFVVLVGECGEDAGEGLRPGISTRVDSVPGTAIQEAKRIRKCWADTHGLKQPAKLFWVIYPNMDSTIPILHSKNAPKSVLTKEKKKHKKDVTKEVRTWGIKDGRDGKKSELTDDILKKELKHGSRTPRQVKQAPA